jgi:tRNA(Leu) C34 or U34 (ribose-2'-O)-methylase TrmL
MQFKFDGAKRLGALKQTCFCVGLKLKIIRTNGFTVDVYRLCLRISRDNHLNLQQKFTFSGNVKKLCHKP